MEGEPDEYDNENEAVRPEETGDNGDWEEVRVKGPKIPPFEESQILKRGE